MLIHEWAVFFEREKELQILELEKKLSQKKSLRIQNYIYQEFEN